MSTTSDLSARVDALEKAVQSLLGAVKILETLHEGGTKGSAKASKTFSTKKRAPAKKRAGKAKAA